MKLTLTDTQQTLVDTLKNKLEDALSNGAGTVPELQSYGELPSATKDTIKNSYALQFAAYVQAANTANNWTNMSLAAGWTAVAGTTYHTPSYRIEGDRVWLRGVATTLLVGTTVTVLPAGHRPSKTVTALGVSLGGTSAPVVVTIGPSGTVTAPAGTISLDGVSFPL